MEDGDSRKDRQSLDGTSVSVISLNILWLTEK